MTKFIRILLMSALTVGILAIFTMPIMAQDSCTSSIESINYGETVTGQISQSSPVALYCFEGQAGDAVIIDLSQVSGTLDTYLELVDNAGAQVLDVNDDRNLSTTDSQITFQLPDTDTYLIRATRFNREDGTTVGEFELSLALDETATVSEDDADSPDKCPILYDSIAYGESYDSTIDDDTTYYFVCFAGEAGDEVVIKAKASDSDLDTFLVLTDVKLEDVLAENDDARIGERDSQIIYTLPESGPYLITMTRYEGDEGTTQGDFTLTVQVNDGTIPEDELFGQLYEPNAYECNRPIIQQLNQTQWLESSENYDFRLNFGCEGLVAISLLGDMLAVPYTLDDDDSLTFMLFTQTYHVYIQADGTLEVTTDAGQDFLFRDVGRCSHRYEQELIEGVWFIDETDSLFRFDFMCNGVAIITLDDLVTASAYEYDVEADKLTLTGTDPIIWHSVFILPGQYMSVETEDSALIFANVLLEIEDTDEADI